MVTLKIELLSQLRADKKIKTNKQLESTVRKTSFSDFISLYIMNHFCVEYFLAHGEEKNCKSSEGKNPESLLKGVRHEKSQLLQMTLLFIYFTNVKHIGSSEKISTQPHNAPNSNGDG